MYSPEAVKMAQPTRNLEYGQYDTLRANNLDKWISKVCTVQGLLSERVELVFVETGGHGLENVGPWIWICRSPRLVAARLL
jgi:hypothetical protein